MPHTRRLARRARLTGESHAQSVSRLRAAPPGYSRRPRSDPHEDQLALEALVLYELVEEFQGSTETLGTLAGIEHARRSGDETVIFPAPELAERIAFRLLPSVDPETGNHYGIAGLRARQRDDHWLFRVLNTDAKILIPARLLPQGIRYDDEGDDLDLRLQWVEHPHALSPEEAKRQWLWAPANVAAATRHTMSSVLRQPYVVRQLYTAETCWVDLFNHWPLHYDLVLEWCCGPTVDEIADRIGSHPTIGQWLQRSYKRDDERPLKLRHHQCGTRSARKLADFARQNGFPVRESWLQ